MQIEQQILSDVVVHSKYARYLPESNRRETFDEIIARNKAMHQKKYNGLIPNKLLNDIYKGVKDKEFLPSMRSLQFAGIPIEVNPVRLFNCSALPIDHPAAFQEIMFLLLSGTGVGFSVQRHHVKLLPELIKPSPKRNKRYLIEDSIQGWSDAVKVLMNSYFKGGPKIKFDFSDIREKGALLVTAGGKAPGPAPLRECLVKIDNLLNDKEIGDKLKPIEVHDIACFIADAVLAGGIRRSAMVSLFSVDDNEMLAAKSGNWWESNPQRGRANNSVVIMRHRVDKKTFEGLWERIQLSGAGEPGIMLSNDKEYLSNPCMEVALRPHGLCNLVEINAATLKDQEDLNRRAHLAAAVATLQAGYTDFHYLREVWKDTAEKDALIGVSLTGLASLDITKFNLREAAEIVKSTNAEIAEMIGINKAVRTTTVKPAGTSSLVLGSSSGIHAWHSKFYIRRMRIGKDEALYNYMVKTNPKLVEDEYFRPDTQAVISIPQKAPIDAITRTEYVLNFLDRIKYVYNEWVVAGHRSGANTNNISATVSIKEDEWDLVGEWMWKNRDNYTALSVLPYDGGNYKQAPFEEISESSFYRLKGFLTNINVKKIIEVEDTTDLKGEAACAGGSCEISEV